MPLDKAKLQSGTAIIRSELNAEIANPFDFLEGVDLYPKWYWENREEDFQIASVGCIHREKEAPKFLSESSPHIRFIGSFCKDVDPFWQNFDTTPFFLPSFEWRLEKGKVSLSSLSLSNQKKAPFTFETINKKQTTYTLFSRVDLPEFPSWEKKVSLSLEKEGLAKVVLARRTSLNFEDPISIRHVLRKLKEIKRNSYLFFYQPSASVAFIGASPEPLYKRVKSKIFSEAIAGTRKRGETPEEDAKNRKELLESHKEKREFHFVQEFLQNTLSPLCKTLHIVNERGIMLTSNVQHLYTKFQGELLSTVSDSDLLRSLHPTPAILGSPREQAFHFLQQEEPFARGLYAAPIGWINAEGAEFAVGIRSCLINEKTAHLFAAAGIVVGSDAEKEWEELEQKMQLFKRGIFGS
jgi:menaquinone-specific isochorismate synthase